MLSFSKTSDAAFIRAVLSQDNPTISKYYRDHCGPMIRQLAHRFPGVDEEVVSTAVNDAVLSVIAQYITTEKIRVEDGKVVGTNRGKLPGLIAYIARCGLTRHCKWEQKYGTANIDDFLRQLEQPDAPLSDEETTKANQSVLKAFSSLNEKCQELLSCRLIHGMTYEDVLNEKIGTSVGGLRVEAHRCVKQLRAKYLKFFFAPSSS